MPRSLLGIYSVVPFPVRCVRRVWLSGGSFLPTIKEQFVLKDCLLFSVPAMLYMLDNNVRHLVVWHLTTKLVIVQ
jgi:hypothetical protein